MEEKYISPLKSIRLKCLDCSGNSSEEVKACPVSKCPLYPFRTGKNTLKKRVLTPEQKSALSERMKLLLSKRKEQVS